MSSTTRIIRPRRLRAQPFLRELVAEHRLHPSDLILPIFIHDGKNLEAPIASMPGVSRLSIDRAVAKAKEAHALGIQAVALFPIVDETKKNERADEALHEDNLACRAIKELKNTIPSMGIIADIALDPYTSHGQDGIIENGRILNDATVDVLAKQALAMAKAGADIVAPSDMMDGRIGAIRVALEEHHFTDTAILSYAAKYASHMYGPFRDAVGSAKQLGSADKKTYQMDFRNSDEALREVELDIAEGADMLMIKPGIAYLDILQRIASTYPLPVFAYQVSGEYAMIKAAGEKGWIDADAVMMEHLLAFKRAGARAIFTYAAIEVAKKL